MSIESLLSAINQLGASMDALAAVGAELRLRRNGNCAPAVRNLFQDAVRHIDPCAFDQITAEQERTALAIIESVFRQSMELLQFPSRLPGWSYSDPAILNGQGLTSRRFVQEFVKLGMDRPDLAAMMVRPGALLDIGTGVGWLAIEAARTWPEWRVVGIDQSESALRLARDNVGASGLGNRIELRAQAAEHLQDQSAFTLAWLPGAFLSPEVVAVALDRVWHALIPGGWMVFGVYAPLPGPGGEALNVLKLVRNGGHPWTPPEVEGRLTATGFAQVESVSAPGTRLVLGKRKHT